MLICLVLFIVYEVLLLPFAYIKVVAHKFALMVKGPSGVGTVSTLDRFGSAFLFLIFGPLLLTLSVIVDIGWFLAHVYKMDLEKSINKVFNLDASEEGEPL